METRKTKNAVRRIITIFLSLVVVFLIFPLSVKAGNMKISEKEIVMVKGATTTISIKNHGHKKVSWKSSKPSVASVNKSGKVKANATGTTKITANVGKSSFSCTVRVVNKTLQYSDFNLHWIENGSEAVHNPIARNSAWSYWSTEYERSTGNTVFSSRKIKTGNSYKQIKRAYGKSSLKRFKLKNDKIYNYLIQGGQTVTFTTDNGEKPYDATKEISLYEKGIKYYVEYPYLYNGYRKYYLRFYLNGKKKVAAIAYISEAYH